MGLFDIFSNKDQQAAAQAQIAGINAGVGQATGNINSGISALNTNYTAALQPFLNNYATASGGVNQLTNLLGITGSSTGAMPGSGVSPLNGSGSTTSGTPSSAMYPTGAAQPGPSTAGTILQTLQNTPGYQFQLQQGNAAINAKQAATGSLDSGNTLLALSNYNQGLAGTTYNQAVQNLMPFLCAQGAAASGIAGVNTGLGNALNADYNTLGNLNYTAQTGIGNANANADLANLTASANMWGAIGGLGGMALGGLGGMGGFSGLGSGLSSAMFGASPVAGSFGPTSVGGAPLSGGTIFGNMFTPSDVNLKENIEPVGELYDGTGVYRYNYKGDVTPRIGVMAQEVEKSRPDAVVDFAGFKAVDYGKATDLAASLAKFVGGKLEDNVVAMPTR